MVVSLFFPPLSNYIKAVLILLVLSDSVAGRDSGFDKKQNAPEDPPSWIAAKSPPNTETTPTDVLVGAAPIMAASPAAPPPPVQQEEENKQERKFLSPRPGAKRHWLLQQGTDWLMSSFSFFQTTTSGTSTSSSGKSGKLDVVSAPRTPATAGGRDVLLEHQDDVLVGDTIISSTPSTSPSAESGDPLQQEPAVADVQSESESTASPPSPGGGATDASATSTSFLLEQEAAARIPPQAGVEGTSFTSSRSSVKPTLRMFRSPSSMVGPPSRGLRSQSTPPRPASSPPGRGPSSRLSSTAGAPRPPLDAAGEADTLRAVVALQDTGVRAKDQYAFSDAANDQVVQNAWYADLIGSYRSEEFLKQASGGRTQVYDKMKWLTAQAFREMQEQGPETFKHLTEKAFGKQFKSKEEMLTEWNKVLDEKMVEGWAGYTYTQNYDQNKEGDGGTNEGHDLGDLAHLSWKPSKPKPGEAQTSTSTLGRIGKELGSGSFGVVQDLPDDPTRVVKTVRCQHFRVKAFFEVQESDDEETRNQKKKKKDEEFKMDTCGYDVYAEIIMNTLLTQAAPNAVVPFDRVVVTRKVQKLDEAGNFVPTPVNEYETSFHFVLERVAIPAFNTIEVIDSNGGAHSFAHLPVDMIAGALRSADGLAKSMYAKILELGDLGFVHNDIKPENMGFRIDHANGVTLYTEPVFFDFGLSSFVAVHDQMTTADDETGYTTWPLMYGPPLYSGMFGSPGYINPVADTTCFMVGPLWDDLANLPYGPAFDLYAVARTLSDLFGEPAVGGSEGGLVLLGKGSQEPWNVARENLRKVYPAPETKRRSYYLRTTTKPPDGEGEQLYKNYILRPYQESRKGRPFSAALTVASLVTSRPGRPFGQRGDHVQYIRKQQARDRTLRRVPALREGRKEDPVPDDNTIDPERKGLVVQESIGEWEEFTVDLKRLQDQVVNRAQELRKSASKGKQRTISGRRAARPDPTTPVALATSSTSKANPLRGLRSSVRNSPVASRSPASRSGSLRRMFSDRQSRTSSPWSLSRFSSARLRQSTASTSFVQQNPFLSAASQVPDDRGEGGDENVDYSGGNVDGSTSKNERDRDAPAPAESGNASEGWEGDEAGAD
ncbi:unnamed protein product [Amoebophrya sp. A120]|nr:unnamed protein product [Amoebophrya sp. A120]|eukprot:GSA120T00008788001.1